MQGMDTEGTPTTEKQPLPDELKAHLAERFKLSHGAASPGVLAQIQVLEDERQLKTDLFGNQLSFLMNNFPDKFSLDQRSALDTMPEWRRMSLTEWGYTDPMPEGIVTLEDVYSAFDRHMTVNNLQEEYEQLLRETRTKIREALRKLTFPVFLEMAEEGFRISFLRS